MSNLVTHGARAEFDDLSRSGLIKEFEISFELAWKAIQRWLADQGTSAANPRSCLIEAIRNNLIPADEESVWLGMLRDRNLAVHTYNVDLAIRLLANIREQYTECLNRLADALRDFGPISEFNEPDVYNGSCPPAT